MSSFLSPDSAPNRMDTTGRPSVRSTTGRTPRRSGRSRRQHPEERVDHRDRQAEDEGAEGVVDHADTVSL